MIEFVRNKETGILEVWKNGIKIGVITTMGDEVHKEAKWIKCILSNIIKPNPEVTRNTLLY